MKTSINYRSYVVSHDGSAYNAIAADGEPFQLRSKNILRVTRAIDALWNALEGKIPLPAWFLMATDVIDIDAATCEAMLVVDQPAAATTRQLVPCVVPAKAVA
jgi:hypothetical protein